MGLRLELPEERDGFREQFDLQLLSDFSDERLMICFTEFTLATGDVITTPQSML